MTLDTALPEHLRGPATTITKIAAGLSGAGVYRVDANGEPFVLKVSAASEPLADWRRRVQIQQLAAEEGLAPHVVHVDEAQRAVTSTLVVDRSFRAFYRDPATHDAAFAELARVIRRVHALTIPVDAEPSDPRSYLAKVWSGLDGFPVPAVIADAVTEALATEPLRDRTFVLSHNDVNPSNLVYDGEKILLVDWDAAGVNDPYFDLAAVSIFLRMDAATCAKLLAAYDATPAAALPERFIWNRRILGVLFCTVTMTLARQGGHAGVPAATSLDDAHSLGDFYQRMSSGAVSLATPEGKWEFALALLKESTLV